MQRLESRSCVFSFFRSLNSGSILLPDFSDTSDLHLMYFSRRINLPEGFRDEKVYPNPSYGDAAIHFILQQLSSVSIKKFDVAGKEMQSLVNQTLDAGEYSYSINTTQFSKEIYLVQMISVNGIQNEKLIVQ